jgi:hypothetical protein
MEQLYLNLSEEEFTKGRKILLWIFAGLFFIAGVYVVTAKPIFGHQSIPPVLATAPFGICFIVSAFATLASIKRKDLFFLVDYGKIEFRYGIFNPKRHSYQWIEIKEMIMPHKQRKIKLNLINGTSFIIDLNFLQRKKSILIRKHIYKFAVEKNIPIVKVQTLK